MAVTRRQLLPFSALSASYFAHIGFFNPYLPLWLKDLGYSLMTLSLLMIVPPATRLVGPLAWGWLSDHTGERIKLLRYASTAALLISLGLWIEGGTAWLALVLFLVFLHTSAMMPMSEAALAHLVSAGGAFDAKRYGRVRLWGSLGFLVTVFVAGAWFEWRGLGDFPAWTVGSLAVVTASAWWLPDLKEEQLAHAPRPSLWPVLRQPAMRWFFASALFHVLAHMGMYIYLSLHLDALGYGKDAIGLMWGISVIVEIVWFYTQGRWLPRLTPAGWLVLCALLTALRMAMTAEWAAWWPVLLLAQALHAFTFAAHHATSTALLSHHFPGRLRGRGQALYVTLAYGVPGLLGGLVGGIISSRLGLSAVFWACAVCALLAAFCAWQVRPADAASGKASRRGRAE